MKLVVSLGVIGFVLAATTPAMAQSDPESAQILCDLTGDCAQEIADPNAAQADPATATGTPRGGKTRGFTFQRAGTTASAPQPTRVASAPQPAPTQRVARPTQVGSSDLGLTFMPNSAVLTDPAKARLAKYAQVLGGPKLNGRRLRIEGHTDASGSAAVNQDLSRRRAQAVADYLSASGVARNRLDVVGYGSSRPLAGKPATAPENRRVMAVLL
ncbi:Outer membrane protein OmpA [Sphingomonas laterariae]|uniref:Outer membrane protein OmpA n=1 Tax=Edaphosphingomonas laterariae TaxID=861865 RepID=A0A239DHJ9_9SPHN|nr:OmpA family protein [Sphingomonas laterariae]SNS31896.1 Outer membrane protein OmpA [Sphingomonas laterariae]